LFERSIGDLEALVHGGRPDARRAFGIFYTASRLARFVAASAVTAMLDEDTELNSTILRISTEGGNEADIDEVVALLSRRKIADLGCGSGVFLTAALDSLLNPYRKTVELLFSGLMGELLSYRQSEILKSSIYGVDRLPQAVELAKLALWLTAARQNEPSADLTANFFEGDSPSTETVDKLLANAGGHLDLILGNPPWGSEFDEDAGRRILRDLGIVYSGIPDSWEIFLALAISTLRPGGRFALLVPETIFSADQKRTREWLLSKCTLEKVYALGPNWFTAKVRMGTVVLQGVTKKADPAHRISTFALAGRNQQDALLGRRPLGQVEALLRQTIPQSVCENDETKQISVLASEWDWSFLTRIASQFAPIR
jgi:SAM-dependent methyltransferase